MSQDGIPYDDKNLGDAEKDQTNQLEKEGEPLPEDIVEFIQKARDELKIYEECKRFYEKKRKKEIILELVDLLEKYDYPREWFRHIISQKLGDYIRYQSYIEKILKERYPDERKKVKEQSTSQIAEIPQNDDKISVEVSSIGKSITDNKSDLRNTGPHDKIRIIRDRAPGEVTIGLKAESERQAETGTQEIVKKLQKRIGDLETMCYQLDQLAQERMMWEKKYNQLHQQFHSYRNKIIKGTAQIEFGHELVPVKIEYNFRTDQFSAKISQEVIERILVALRRVV